MNALASAEFRHLNPPEPSPDEERRAELAYDYAVALIERIPEAVYNALDAALPGWVDRVSAELESRELARLEREAELDEIGRHGP